MTTPKPIGSPGARQAVEPLSRTEKLEEDAAVAGVAAAGALRVAPFVLIGLVVCPPLAILVFLVVVPLLVMALVLGLLFAVLSTPFLLVHHLRARHQSHLSLLAHRLRRAGRALIDLAPHRIVADARQVNSGR
jgi:hypothetical protein